VQGPGLHLENEIVRHFAFTLQSLSIKPAITHLYMHTSYTTHVQNVLVRKQRCIISRMHTHLHSH